MNIHLRRHTNTDTRSAPATTTPTPTDFGNSGSPPRRTTIWRQLLRPTTAGTAAPQPTHVEATMNATHTTSRNTDNRSRSRSRSGIAKKTGRRMRPHTQRNRSNPYIYTATPFTTHLHTTQHAQPPRSIPDRCKTLLNAVRRKLYLLKFSFLLQFGRFRTWFSRKLKQKFSGLGEWLDIHIPRSAPEPTRRPLFQHCPNSCDAAMRAAGRNGSSNGSGGARNGQGKKGGRLRRLSESTVKSLKKACTLNSERVELREEDRRAMRRLDELWRSEEVF